VKEERHKERAAGKGNNKREGRSASGLRWGCCCFVLLQAWLYEVVVSQVRFEAGRANGGWEMERVGSVHRRKGGRQLPAMYVPL
jgi:hypothetical protein